LRDLVHSVVVEQLSEHELICASEPAWERGEGEAVAEQQPPRVSGDRETPGPPTWHAKCRSGFMTLPPVPLQEQPAVVLLLEGIVVSWSLAIDERNEHEDLCGSGHRSVVPYVHGRTELYCSSMPCLFSAPEKWHLPDPFIAQGWAVTMSLEARQVAPRWLKLYTAARVLMARSSK
jgi:hypothetical protein